MNNVNQITGSKKTLTVLLLFIILIILLPLFSFAQSANVDTVTSRRGTKIFILENHADRMKIMAQLLFLNLECGTGDAFKLGAGVEGDYFLPKMASAHMQYVKSYLDVEKFSAGTLNKGSNALSGASLFEIGGRFHMVDVKARKRFKTKLSHNASFVDQYNSGNSIPENYLIARLPARRIFAARAGLYRASAIVNTDMNKKELAVGDYGAVKTKDGTVLTNVYYTNAHTTGIYLGISEIFNIWVRIKPDIEQFRGHTYIDALFREVYADVILAGTSFDPIVIAGRSYEIEPNTKGSFQTSKLGFRIGKKVIITRKTLNLGFSFELGDRPGVKGRGAYFGTGMSLAFVK